LQFGGHAGCEVGNSSRGLEAIGSAPNIRHTARMHAPDPIQKALEDIFPSQVAVCFSAERPDRAELHPEELPSTTKMVAARKLEFGHGRSCARAALVSLGLPAIAIPMGSNREPVWPGEVVGSISHTGDSAAAVTALHSKLDGLGLDMETDEPLGADLIAMICRDDEHIAGDGSQAKLLFSIKEAIYKCIYPSVREFVDFLEMKVILDATTQRFTAQACTPSCEPELIARLEGAYRMANGLVLSGAWLRPAVSP
jgi:4'-phosphopantetheinyl transferase EntD